MFAQIEPFGEERADLRAALVAWTMASSAGAQNLQLSDFLLRFEPQRPQSQQDMLIVVEMWNDALGGLDLRLGRADADA